MPPFHYRRDQKAGGLFVLAFKIYGGREPRRWYSFLCTANRSCSLLFKSIQNELWKSVNFRLRCLLLKQISCCVYVFRRACVFCSQLLEVRWAVEFPLVFPSPSKVHRGSNQWLTFILFLLYKRRNCFFSEKMLCFPDTKEVTQYNTTQYNKHADSAETITFISQNIFILKDIFLVCITLKRAYSVT